MASDPFRQLLARNPVFCALDTRERATAEGLARTLAGAVGGLKLGLEFFAAEGPDGVRALAKLGLPIFLDLKLHDIPNTVAGALRALAPLGVALVNVHAAGGLAMMQAAASAAAEAGSKRPRVLAVTVLTSLDGKDLAMMGIAETAANHVVHLARLARQAGLDGVVCSAQEIAAVREACGPDFLIVVPGLRPAGAATGDQKRMATPGGARAAGADVLVIGRPITAAPDPAQAARAIATEIGLRPMSLDVKICGLKTEAALDAAIEAGAAYVGFIFFPRSPRAIDIEVAARLRHRVPDAVRVVAVVVDADDKTLDRIVTRVEPDLLQLHGRETPTRASILRRRYHRPVMKAIPVAERADLDAALPFAEAEYVLFDAKPALDDTRPGGNARAFDWSLTKDLKLTKPWFLAGGLTPDNLAEAVRLSGARAVDVSSGVESAPGEKDIALIRKLLDVARTL